MEDNNIEIIDDNNEVKVDNNQSTSVVVSDNKSEVTMGQTQVIETVLDKKQLKKQEKQKKLEEKKRKKLEKKNKGKNIDINQQNTNTSNVEEASEITIVETAITKGASGSQVIGNIEGESIYPTNVPLPEPIDITVKQKLNNKSKVQKVKIVSKKEKIFSVLISIFVILGFLGGGFAIYYFGYKTNPSLYTLKTIYLELGEHLPSTVSYYIENSNQYDDMEYNLDISNVAQNIIGTYTYTVSHKNVKKSAQVIVRDTLPPTLTIKDEKNLVFQKNSKVSKENIVSLCEDLSNCTYKTEYDISTESPGEKEITVIARDDVGNETRKQVTINIIDVQKILVCTSPDVESPDKKFKYNNVYTLSFDGNDYLVKQSGVIQYTYSDYAAYFDKLNELQSDSKYIFNRTNFSYTEPGEVKTNNLTKFNDLVSYYNENGFTCK